ncbi:hypothetical protein ACFL6S_00820 [Candidatus Poribacteria bacterium]
MDTKNDKLERLRRGRDFHKKIQEDWCENAEGDVRIEEWTTKPSGRKGRMDVFVGTSETDERLVAIAEIKASDWDAMTPSAVRRNVRRQIRQIWSYITPQLESRKDVSPGIIFEKRPKDPDRMKLIEELFLEDGIPVVWDDESIEELKARS